MSPCLRLVTVSGGCLDNDVSKKAWWFTEGGNPAVRAYDTSSDDDAVWEFGLGCNGVVHVLFERIENPETQELLRFLDANRAARRGAEWWSRPLWLQATARKRRSASGCYSKREAYAAVRCRAQHSKRKFRRIHRRVS